MPQGNRTGPRGEGSKTGRQLGDCEGAKPIERGFGRGLGRGFGFRCCPRFGFRNFQTVEVTKAEQKKILEQEFKELDLDKKEIEKRLKELKTWIKYAKTNKM